MSEEEIIRVKFQNVLDKLVSSKIRPTATAIISARQPMVLLFEELMYKLDKLQKENEELKSKKQLEIDTSEEVLKWKAKYHLLSRKIDVISKDKIRKIIYPSPDNMIPLEVQTSDMYMKLKNLVEENE